MSLAFNRNASLARLLVGVFVGLTASVAVWLAASTEQSVARAGAREAQASERMLTAMLDQESSFRAYAELRRESFLRPYYEARAHLESATASARSTAAGDEPEQARRIQRQNSLARTWQSSADDTIARIRTRAPNAVDVETAIRRRELVRRFRDENAEMRRSIDREREAKLAGIGRLAAGVMLLMSVLLGVGGSIAIQRRARAVSRRRAAEATRSEAQAEFTETLHAMSDEAEAHALVQRHLERSLPESDIAILNRNNSDNRLSVAAPLPDGSSLAERLGEAETTSCLAIRLGKTYRDDEGSQPLLKCQLCDRSGVSALCTPSVVGGEVIGSVLVQRPEPLTEDERALVGESVERAAPLLANLRNLAVAETRAATDALTGLANRRSAEETLKRMVAQSIRTEAPLSAIIFDLDHFKRTNDVHGHGKGDEVLAAVGDRVGSVVRASDFAGRYGGEEFLVLAPDTDDGGALRLAEKLREAIHALEIPHLDRAVSASFGVATFPHDVQDPAELIRTADRALYSAKAKGRNRVERVTSEPSDAHNQPGDSSPTDGSIAAKSVRLAR